MEVGGQQHDTTAFIPGKDPVPVVQVAGWASGPVWFGAKNLALTGNFFFVLCTSSVLLFCPDCPGCAFYPHCTTHTTQTSMPPAEFEPAIPTGERLQTHASDRSATGIGGIRSPDLPARSESLYRLHHPGSWIFKYSTLFNMLVYLLILLSKLKLFVLTVFIYVIISIRELGFRRCWTAHVFVRCTK